MQEVVNSAACVFRDITQLSVRGERLAGGCADHCGVCCSQFNSQVSESGPFPHHNRSGRAHQHCWVFFVMFLMPPLFYPNYPESASPIILFTGQLYETVSKRLCCVQQVRHLQLSTKKEKPGEQISKPVRRTSSRRSAYAFSHEQGYGHLITSGKNMRLSSVSTFRSNPNWIENVLKEKNKVACASDENLTATVALTENKTPKQSTPD